MAERKSTAFPPKPSYDITDNIFVGDPAGGTDPAKWQRMTVGEFFQRIGITASVAGAGTTFLSDIIISIGGTIARLKADAAAGLMTVEGNKDFKLQLGASGDQDAMTFDGTTLAVVFASGVSCTTLNASGLATLAGVMATSVSSSGAVICSTTLNVTGVSTLGVLNCGAISGASIVTTGLGSFNTLSTVGDANFGAAVGATGSFTGVDFIQSSDERLKKIGKKLGGRLAHYYEYEFLDNEGATRIGVKAQQVREVYPSVVHEGANGMLSVSYQDLHSAEIAALWNEIDKLKDGSTR